jgi:hypothetical protein
MGKIAKNKLKIDKKLVKIAVYLFLMTELHFETSKLNFSTQLRQGWFRFRCARRARHLLSARSLSHARNQTSSPVCPNEIGDRLAAWRLRS